MLRWPRAASSLLLFFVLLTSIYEHEVLAIHSVSKEEHLQSERTQVTARLKIGPRLRVPNALEAIAMLLLALNPTISRQGFSAEHVCGLSFEFQGLQSLCQTNFCGGFWHIVDSPKLKLQRESISGGSIRSRATSPQLQAAAEQVPSIHDLKVYELRAICRAKGLQVKGKKSDLIQRIEAAPEGLRRTVKQSGGRKNGWTVFLQKYREDHEEFQNQTIVEATKAASVQWKLMSDEEQKPFLAEAQTIRDEYKKQMATSVLQSASTPPFATASPIPDASQVVQEFFNADGSAAPEAQSFNAGGTTADVEVLTEGDAMSSEVDELRAARRARRNERLKTYFSEEYTKVQGELQALAGSDYKATFDSPKMESVSLMGIPLKYSVPSSRASLPALVQGYKMAWCRSFDPATGMGVIVSMDDKQELQVPREALKTREDLPMMQRRLYPGEFVQYDPFANKSATAGLRWVSGVSDWPLMCQTCADQGLTDLLASEQKPAEGKEPDSQDGFGNMFSWLQGKDGKP